MTAQERSALAEKFGLSEDLLLRCERAHHAYCTTILEKQTREAKLEAIFRMREFGKELDDPQFGDEISKALHRIQDATPENEVTREYDEAWAVLRAALEAPPSTPKK